MKQTALLGFELGAHWIAKLLARVGCITKVKARDLDSTGCDLSIRVMPSTKAKTRAKGYARSIVGAGRLQSTPSHASSMRSEEAVEAISGHRG